MPSDDTRTNTKTALQELVEWSTDLPNWLSDAARRALQKGTLDSTDFDDLAALLMAEHEISDAQERSAIRLDTSMIPAEAEAGKSVSLSAIREPLNVNALDHPPGITFGQNGLTIVFGQNGAGKSGYARLLKRACRARDQEPILPNIYQDSAEPGQAKAKFEWYVGGIPDQGLWTDNGPLHDHLSAIAVFDGRCARVFVDDEQEVSVVPYGVDVLREMARCCVEVKLRIEEKARQSRLEPAPLVPLQGETSVGRFVRSLSKDSNKDELRSLANLADEERQERTSLIEKLRDDPMRKAEALRKMLVRLKNLQTEIESLTASLSDSSIEDFLGDLQRFFTAREVSRLASEELSEDGRALFGTGNDPWRQLMASAMDFAALHAYPNQPFPAEEAGSRCVLCQQELSPEASSRLRSFVQFLQADAQKRLVECREDTLAHYQKIEALKPEIIPSDKTILDEIAERNITLPPLVHAYVTALKDRQDNILGMARTEIGLISPLPETPITEIQAVHSAIEGEVAELEEMQRDEERLRLQTRLNELEARNKLGELMSAVEEVINTHILLDRLSSCIKATNSAGITRKATELTEAALAKGFKEALAHEFSRLKVAEMKVDLDLRGQKGKGLQQLKLTVPKSLGKVKLSEILSEGEQRAIAIGCFLAEVRLAPHNSGIVFDDPVSSVDSVRRALIADRFVEESLVRQVIVFTHDLSFAWQLTTAATTYHASVTSCRVYSGGAKKGLIVGGLPFEAGKVDGRIRVLKESAERARKLLEEEGKPDEGEELIRIGYKKLRDVWERFVEEGLFGDVVSRFCISVNTQSLKMACVEDEDFVAVHKGMTKCSHFSHEPSREAPTPTPSPQEFLEDLVNFEAIYNRVMARAKETEKRRKALVR